MVCANNTSSASSTKKDSKIQKGCVTKKRTAPNKPMDRELHTLRSLIPNGAKPKSDLDVILDTISYIQTLEEKLRTQSSPALLKARYLTIHRMSLQQCEL